MTTGWSRVIKEQNIPSSTFSNHGVKVQSNNQNRIDTFYVLLDLPERFLFIHWIKGLAGHYQRQFNKGWNTKKFC